MRQPQPCANDGDGCYERHQVEVADDCVAQTVWVVWVLRMHLARSISVPNANATFKALAGLLILGASIMLELAFSFLLASSFISFDFLLFALWCFSLWFA